MDIKAKALAVLRDAAIEAGRRFETLSPKQIKVIQAEAQATMDAKHGRATAVAGDLVRKRYELLQQRARP